MFFFRVLVAKLRVVTAEQLFHLMAGFRSEQTVEIMVVVN